MNAQAAPLLLAIDAGNTETKIGIFDCGRLVHTWRLRTERTRTPDEYASIFAQLFAMARITLSAIEEVVIASVVPSIDRSLVSACKQLLGCTPYFFTPTTQRMITVRTERPSEVGADLLAAALAARERRGAPVIVVTFGTATTFAAISADGAYLGVAIAPGMQVSLDALIGSAAKLPQIALEAPSTAIGRTTIAALQSGVLFGVVGQTEGIVARFRAELGVEAPVVASGGLADVVAAHTKAIDEVIPFLVLEGLALYAARLRNDDAESSSAADVAQTQATVVIARVQP